MFLTREILKAFWFPRTPRIAFIFPGFPRPYYRAWPSVRIRAYDVIRGFEDASADFFLEIYKPWKRYTIAIFQSRDARALELATKLRKKGVRILLDVNANLYDQDVYGKGPLKNFDQNSYETLIAFTEIADAVLTVSPHIADTVTNLFPEKAVMVIPEIIPAVFFSAKKQRSARTSVTFVYGGYAEKAKEILLIKDCLQLLAKRYEIEYLFLCEKNPDIDLGTSIRTRFKKYDPRTVNQDLLRGDIFLAPRNLQDPYNLGHSFTKIGLPMALGIPVIASPVPAYNGAPAVFLSGFQTAEWTTPIERLLVDRQAYNDISDAGIAYCKTHYSAPAVIPQYDHLFRSLLDPQPR